jgi:aspartate aminotransferase
LIDSDAALAAYLLRGTGVAAVPGSAFGLSPFLRISCAASIDELEHACTRLAQAVQRLA